MLLAEPDGGSMSNLVAAFGAPYEGYRREVGAILPFVR